MLIELELNVNDAEALLRHSLGYQPNSGDRREDSRLTDALDTLAATIRDAMSKDDSREPVDPTLLEAATRLFDDKALAVEWLSRPKRALGGKRPTDVDLEEALNLIARLEHGFPT